MKKGDPLQTARLAGVMAAKQTSALIPLCHPLQLSHVDVDLIPTRRGYRIESRVRTTAQTGVEMEALTAVAVAALTVYDMVKAVDKAMEITDIYLVEKTGGRSGAYCRRITAPSEDPAEAGYHAGGERFRAGRPITALRSSSARSPRWGRWRSTCTCQRCRPSRATSTRPPRRCRSAWRCTSSALPAARPSTVRSRIAGDGSPRCISAWSCSRRRRSAVRWPRMSSALIALRFLQALGGCAPLVVPRAIVRDYFDQRGSVRMLSVLMLVVGLAPILAPLIGGQLLVNFGWRSVFWVLAGYGVFWLAHRGPVSAGEPPRFPPAP